MNAAELPDELNRAGATLEIVDDKPRIRGAKISKRLMQALKANRAEVLAEFERRKTENRDRCGRVPPANAPMLARAMDVPVLWKLPQLFGRSVSQASRQSQDLVGRVQNLAGFEPLFLGPGEGTPVRDLAGLGEITLD